MRSCGRRASNTLISFLAPATHFRCISLYGRNNSNNLSFSYISLWEFMLLYISNGNSGENIYNATSNSYSYPSSSYSQISYFHYPIQYNIPFTIDLYGDPFFERIWSILSIVSVYMSHSFFLRTCLVPVHFCPNFSWFAFYFRIFQFFIIPLLIFLHFIRISW